MNKGLIYMYKLKFAQKLPISVEESWAFFSQPTNLLHLTPPHLGFEMLDTEKNKKIYPGQIISHLIRPFLKIPIEWTSEIVQVHEPYYFIDHQICGPYRFWHHEHRFNPIDKGVEIVDLIHYKLPLGYIGQFFHFVKVQKEIQTVFSYRKRKLEELFGKYLY